MPRRAARLRQTRQRARSCARYRNSRIEALVGRRSGVFLASVMEPIDSSNALGVALLRIRVALARKLLVRLNAKAAGDDARGSLHQDAFVSR